MKRLLKFVTTILVVYLLYRLFEEYLRPSLVGPEKMNDSSPSLHPTSPAAQPIIQPTPTPTQPDRVDLNQANSAALATLPGIGPALAERIIAYRQQSGSFSSVDELTRVSGIGPALLKRIRPLITLN